MVALSFGQEAKLMQESINRGAEIYEDFCLHCHLPDGKGNAQVPPLAKSDWLVNKRTASIHAIKYGQSGPIVVNGKKYNSSMPPMGLSNQEVSDVMNYISNSWGNVNKNRVSAQVVDAIKP